MCQQCQPEAAPNPAGGVSTPLAAEAGGATQPEAGWQHRKPLHVSKRGISGSPPMPNRTGSTGFFPSLRIYNLEINQKQKEYPLHQAMPKKQIREQPQTFAIAGRKRAVLAKSCVLGKTSPAHSSSRKPAPCSWHCKRDPRAGN